MLQGGSLMPSARLFYLALILALSLVVASCGPSTPVHYHCSYDAKQSIKKHLAFPSTFDEHVSLSNSKARSFAAVMGNEDSGWSIRTPMVFGTKNAFGVQSDYLVWYTATVDTEGDCTGVTLDNFIPYSR